MKKYFVVSDVHSCYDALIKALNKKHFDPKNKNHILVVLGDIFDRGDKPIELYEFLKSIPNNRLVLVRGNHEDIFTQLINSPLPDETDYYNGTVSTLCKIVNIAEEKMDYHYWQSLYYKTYSFNPEIMYRQTWYTVKNKVLNSEIYKFITSRKWKNFFELDNYIFVHGFIPLVNGKYYTNWRNLDKEHWEGARWLYGYKESLKGNYQETKALVCGHVPTSFIRDELEQTNIKNPNDIININNVICIDGGAYFSDQINVFVVEQ